MVQFKIHSPKNTDNLLDLLFIPCHVFHGELIALRSDLLSDTRAEDEDSDHGCHMFFNEAGAWRLLREWTKVYGKNTHDWKPHVTTLREYLRWTVDDHAMRLARRMGRRPSIRLVDDDSDTDSDSDSGA